MNKWDLWSSLTQSKKRSRVIRFGNNRRKIYVFLCWDYKPYCWLNCLCSSVVSKAPECFRQHSTHNRLTLAERQVPVLHACVDIYICRQGWRISEGSRSRRRGIPRWIYHVSQLLHHTLHHLRPVLEQLRWELLIQPSLAVTHRSTAKQHSYWHSFKSEWNLTYGL